MKRAPRALLCAACFASTLIAACFLLGAALPPARVPDVFEKWDHFARHKEEFDALFLGSSRVFRQIDPAEFDRELHAHGLQSRAFNAGIFALFPPEDSFVLDQFLDTRPAHLRTVFVEIGMFFARFERQDPHSLRTLHWHDGTRLRFVRRVLFDDFKFKRNKWRTALPALAERLEIFAAHAALTLRNAVNLGRGAQLLPWSPAAAAPAWALGPRLDGFPRPDDTQATPDERARYERELAVLLRSPARRTPLPAGAQDNLEHMIGKIRGAGAQPVLLISPAVSPLTFVPRRDVAPVLDFSDPARWPELFAPESRLDAGHLTHAASERYTRLLAREFLALGAARLK